MPKKEEKMYQKKISIVFLAVTLVLFLAASFQTAYAQTQAKLYYAGQDFQDGSSVYPGERINVTFEFKNS